MKKRVSFDAVLEREALASMLEGRGPAAVEDVRQLQAEASKLLDALKGDYARGTVGLKDFLQRGRTVVRSLVEYDERIAALERIWQAPVSAFVDPSERRKSPEVPRRLLELIVEGFDHEATATLRRLLSEFLSQTRARHAMTLNEIDIERRAYAREGNAYTCKGSPGQGQDVYLTRIRDLLKVRRELDQRLATLEQTQWKMKDVQAERVAQVFDAAGGVEVVIRAVTEAQVSSRRATGQQAKSPDPMQPLIDAMSRERDEVVTKLRRLGVPPATVRPGTMAQALALRAAELQDRIQAMSADIQSRQVTKNDELVARALKGDESARAEIETLARRVSDVFPSGFAKTLAAAQFERSELGYLLVEAVLGPEA